MLADVWSGMGETGGNAAFPLTSTSAVWQVDSLVEQMLDRLAQPGRVASDMPVHAGSTHLLQIASSCRQYTKGCKAGSTCGCRPPQH